MSRDVAQLNRGGAHLARRGAKLQLDSGGEAADVTVSAALGNLAHAQIRIPEEFVTGREPPHLVVVEDGRPEKRMEALRKLAAVQAYPARETGQGDLGGDIAVEDAARLMQPVNIAARETLGPVAFLNIRCEVFEIRVKRLVSLGFEV